MKEDVKNFIACDAETEYSGGKPEHHAYLECDTAFHQESPNAFLSLFTKRDGYSGEPIGTEVWLNVDSVLDLIKELSKCSLKHGADIEDLTDAIGLPELEIDYDEEGEVEEDDIEYHSDNLESCPYCKSNDLGEYIQPSGSTCSWCNICGMTLRDGT